MKNAAAGLLVTLGLLVCSKAHAEPSRSAATEGAQAKTAALRDDLSSGQAPKAATPLQGIAADAPTGLTLFNAADGDHDGSVSYRELSAVVRTSITRRIQVRFRQLDRNHDGRITRREVNKMTAARFARFDVNHDGMFTSTELARAMTEPVTVRLHDVYARLDTDGNGALSMAELAPRPKQQPVMVASVSKDPGHKVTDVAKRTSTVH